MKIGEVSKEYQISMDTIRYYEKIGLLGPIAKNKSGIREFKQEDLKQIEFVKCMRGAAIPIEALVQYMNLYKQGDSTIQERKQILMNQKKVVEKQLENLQKAYERLNYKIERYDKQLLDKMLGGKSNE